MGKIAIITLRLVDEGEAGSNEEIADDIKYALETDNLLPWQDMVLKVTVLEEVES